MIVFKLVVIIIGLLILAVIGAYIATISVQMVGFIIGLVLKTIYYRFNSKGKTSDNSRNQSWNTQIKEYLINCIKNIWCTPIWNFKKIGQSNRMAEYQGNKPTQNRPKKSPTNIIPDILSNSVFEPTPETHLDKHNIVVNNESTKSELNPLIICDFL